MNAKKMRKSNGISYGGAAAAAAADSGGAYLMSIVALFTCPLRAEVGGFEGVYEFLFRINK